MLENIIGTLVIVSIMLVVGIVVYNMWFDIRNIDDMGRGPEK